MIFITVGTQNFQLNRLLRQVDSLIERGEIAEPVFAQIGHSDYLPKHYEFTRFLAPEEFESRIAKCDMMISHSGVGSIICGKRYKKPIIVFPRLSRYGEHIDDHQTQIAYTFHSLNFVVTCEDESKLGATIQYARVHEFAEYQSNREKAVGMIKNYFKEVDTLSTSKRKK